MIGRDGPSAVTVRAPDGHLIARVELRGDTFAVGYRNSVYTTLAEERYRVLPDGRFELVELAAEQIAVLEEYYAVPGAPRPAPAGDRLDFVADPDPPGRPYSTTFGLPPPTWESAHFSSPVMRRC